MECPIKVNRHKGGKVTFICVAQLAVVFRAAWVQIPSEPEILSVFFSAVGKIAARLRRSMLFFYFTSATPKKLLFFTNTQLKLAQRGEP